MAHQRLPQYDFVKGILITLMVMFHLHLIVEHYFPVRQWVYAFHMSAFLILSGFFFNDARNKFIPSLRTIFLPYLLFGSIYVIALACLQNFLPTSNRIDTQPLAIINTILLHPTGTYWYLHTMTLCMVGVFVGNFIKTNFFNQLICIAVLLFTLTLFIDAFSWIHVVYFLIGYVIRKTVGKLDSVIIPSLISIVPIILITYFEKNLSRETMGGIALTIFMISFLLQIYKYSGKYIANLFVWIGRNSLSILLFSPFFTIITKLYIPLFSFDSTHLLWTAISLSFVIAATILCAYVCDRIKLSKFLMNRNMYTSYRMACNS